MTLALLAVGFAGGCAAPPVAEYTAMPHLLTVDDYLAAPVVPADVRLAYGPLPDQFADLYLPAIPGPHPVMLLIHGGCWHDRFDLAPLGPFAAALRAEGYAVYSLEYRRLDGAGGWPMTFADVGAGADYLRTVAARHHLDLSRVVAVGHSAGGHLALWLAARAGLPATSSVAAAHPLPLRAVVGLAALGDLEAAAAQELCGGAVPELVGQRPERYAEASPAARLPLGTPHFHLAGSADPIVPAAYVAAFVAAAQAAGDNATLTVVADAGHFELTTPGSPAWPDVLAAVRQAFAVPADQ
jgi:acetyl esterase/lipase